MVPERLRPRVVCKRCAARGRLVWPTMVLAGKLDQALARRFPGAASAADFHARYLDAGIRLALPAPRLRPGQERR